MKSERASDSQVAIYQQDALSNTTAQGEIPINPDYREVFAAWRNDPSRVTPVRRALAIT
jgi:hypothetical protein